jgi:hypothetical protein
LKKNFPSTAAKIAMAECVCMASVLRMDRLRTRSIFQSKILSTVLWECISGKILGGNRVYRCSQSNSGSHPSKCAVSIVP